MKRINSIPKIFTYIPILLILTFGCKNDNDPEPGQINTPQAIINSIDPASGPFGTEVTITGKNFLEDSVTHVTFNNTEAEIKSITDSQIVTVTPKKAGVGPVRVISAKNTARSIDFHFEYTPVVTTIAGTGESGFEDGSGEKAQFYNPIGIAGYNDELFIADFYNDRIREILPEGDVETFVFDKDNNDIVGRFTDIVVAPDASYFIITAAARQLVYFANSGGEVYSFVGFLNMKGYQDGKFSEAMFNDPWSVSLDPNEKRCYISDRLNHCIRVIDFDQGNVSTFAGTNTAGFENGNGTKARFNSPNGIDMDSAGNLYVADRNNHSIRKITPNREVSTIAGDGTPAHRDGPARQALFNKPRGLALDHSGNIYVADFENNCIRKIDTKDMVTTVINGLSNEGFKDGVAEPDHPSGQPQAQINGPNDLYVAEDGTIYFTDQGNHAVRRISFE